MLPCHRPAFSATLSRAVPSSFRQHRSRLRRSSTSCAGGNPLLLPLRLQPLSLLVAVGAPLWPPPLPRRGSSLPPCGVVEPVTDRTPSLSRPPPNLAASASARGPEMGDPEMEGTARREMVTAPLLDLHFWMRPSPRLVCSDRPERRVLSCLDPPATQAIPAFEGQAYQYKVLPFGLSLSPRVFTKVVEAALVPLREQGVRILNYLDDWLILAQSRKQLSAYRDLVLKHLSLLGLRVNWEKSKLVPTQRISFLGMEFDSVNQTARLTQERAQSGVSAVSGVWTGPQLHWHINCLELLAVRLALSRLRGRLQRKDVLVRTDNTATVAYINRQGGLRSRRMSQLARHLLLWSQKHLRSLRAIHIPGVFNRAAVMMYTYFAI